VVADGSLRGSVRWPGGGTDVERGTPSRRSRDPEGLAQQYEWDEERQAIKLDRFLFSSVAYPGDYGFFPNTLDEDGDPLDAAVCVGQPTFPGIVIPVKVIALFRMRDAGDLDDKILCVPCEDPEWNHMETLDDVPAQLCREIAHFFSIYKELEGRRVEVDGWRSRDDAFAVIDAARRRYAERG
jgi:inorganic pyrophosphatase